MDAPPDDPTASAELADYLVSPGRHPDPYPLFKRVRDVEPVHWSEIGTWVVLGLPEARAAFKDPYLSRLAAAEELAARFPAPPGPGRDAVDTWMEQFVNLDGDKHRKVRGLVSHAFARRAVMAWEAAIIHTVDDLIDSVRDREFFDVLHDFGYLLPSQVICAMVGVPFSDHELFERWITDWLNLNSTDPGADVSAGLAPLVEFTDYMTSLVRDRKRSPRADDLVSILLAAEEDAGVLAERQVVAALMNLVVGGHETVANLIPNSVLATIRHPDQAAMLRADPGLIVSAVEEFLRYDSPARGQHRIALADTTVGDKLIRAGEHLQVIAYAANHDGRVFEDPDGLHLDRISNGHVAFGSGAHFCIGLHIARLEARYAIGALVRELGPLQLASEELNWRNAHVRALTALPVSRAS